MREGEERKEIGNGGKTFALLSRSILFNRFENMLILKEMAIVISIIERERRTQS